ncbi:hypothetical protein LOK49_Contig274G00001 [Camellia lanceoleosa]|nr:hypothetical protein LOK49_Contig274G00001 [Camellia lanceoleosa]
MDKVMESIGKSPVRSVFIFQRGVLPKKTLLGTVAANFKLLKVVDVKDAPLDQVHEEMGNLFLLRYLIIRNTKVKIIPKSIVSYTSSDFGSKHSPRELPFDVGRLHKLQHLLAYSRNYESESLGGFNSRRRYKEDWGFRGAAKFVVCGDKSWPN